MSKTLKNIPPIRGIQREPRDTDASVVIGGATAQVGTFYSVKIDGVEHAIPRDVYSLLMDLMHDVERAYTLRSIKKEAGKK